MTRYILLTIFFCCLAPGAVLVVTRATFAESRKPSPNEMSVSAGSIPVASPQARHEKLMKILSRREFAASRNTLFDRIVSWVKEVIARFFRWLIGKGNFGGGLSEVVSVVLAVIIILLFALLLVFALTKLSITGVRVMSESRGKDSLYDGPESAQAALSEASRMASEGDFRSALRLVYLAVLIHLDDRELIRFDRTRTNWEYLHALKNHTEVQKTLMPVTITFDHKWYGHEETSDSDYRSFLDAYHSIESYEVTR